ATLQPDGSLGPFASPPGINLTVPRSEHTAAVVGDQLYVIGGFGPLAALNTIEHATIGADGALTKFATADSKLTVPRAGHTSAVIGDGLYVIGGRNDDGPVASVERAAIAPDGTLGAFAVV